MNVVLEAIFSVGQFNGRLINRSVYDQLRSTIQSATPRSMLSKLAQTI